MVLCILVRKVEKVACVNRVWPVLLAQLPEHASERYYFSPVKLAYKRQTVEDKPVHEICQVP